MFLFSKISINLNLFGDKIIGIKCNCEWDKTSLNCIWLISGRYHSTFILAFYLKNSIISCTKLFLVSSCDHWKYSYVCFCYGSQFGCVHIITRNVHLNK